MLWDEEGNSYENESHYFSTQSATPSDTGGPIINTARWKEVAPTIAKAEDYLGAQFEQAVGLSLPELVWTVGIGDKAPSKEKLDTFFTNLVGTGALTGIFGGRFTKQALAAAERLEGAGMDPRSIKLATGLERGADTKWRLEFSDAGSKFNRSKFRDAPKDTFKEKGVEKFARLEEVFEHPSLYEAYPEARDIPIVLNKESTDQGTFYRGANPGEGVISLSSKLDDTQARSVLLHEIQHWVQYKEGFAGGGRSEYINQELSDSVKRTFLKTEKEEYIKGIEKLVREGRLDEAREYAKNVLESADYRVYESIMGEQEASAVQARSEYTLKQLRQMLGSAHETVPREKQIKVNRP